MSVGNKNLPWLQALQQISAASEPYVLITILGARGSTPRDSGTKMVVTQEHTYDTIGGGHLEYKAIQQAREFLLQSESVQHLEHYPLGAELGQTDHDLPTQVLDMGQRLPVDELQQTHMNRLPSHLDR